MSLPSVMVELKPYSFDPDRKFYHITIDGRTVAGITAETPAPARDKFIELCKQNVEKLNELLIAADAKREWNFAESNAGRCGRDWPEFRNLERFKRNLLDQAGVRDS